MTDILIDLVLGLWLLVVTWKAWQPPTPVDLRELWKAEWAKRAAEGRPPGSGRERLRARLLEHAAKRAQRSEGGAA